MSGTREWWQKRGTGTRRAIVLLLVLATAALGAATVKGTYRSPGSTNPGSPLVAVASVRDDACAHRGARVLRGASTGSAYLIALHTFQRDCPFEAQRRALTGFPLRRCKTLTESACTSFVKLPWSQDHGADTSELAVAAGAALDGKNVAELAVGATSNGETSLRGAAIRIDRTKTYSFTAYLRGAGAGTVTAHVLLAALDRKGNELYYPAPLDFRVLRPARGVRAPHLDGSIDLDARWQRFGGFLPPRTWSKRVVAARPLFQFAAVPTTGETQVLLDAVQLEPGDRATPFTASHSGNLVPDPSFELGGFAS